MNQRRLLALAGALLLALPGCAPASSGESPAPEGTYQVYYSAMGDEHAPAAVDSAAYTLPEDAPPVPALLQALLSQPEQAGLSSPFPAGVRLLDWKRDACIWICRSSITACRA